MPSRLVLIVLATILGLWTLGAYNRLVRLRNSMRTAFAPLASQLRQRHAVALTLAEVSRTRITEPQDEALIEATLTSASQAGRASDNVQQRPLRGDVLQQLAIAEEVLVAALDELGHALQDLTSGIGPDPVVSDLLRQRDALQEQIAFSRLVYNQSADEYNRAVALFPTTLVAGLFGFHAAPEFPPI
ncbi:LemA family protein [Leptothrix cholodnii SP-6]|uniref:LemA family protein n=1 Tax=Leptothrix cholodnii (strain ATCC 51168 / LMG 8142 / SP-6) TaxID=395495 RepID=B1Y8J3_LEPCP|nr:LemA family protein [Leptothrix cholodnii]ACB36259.1 LemA family protein [Leptothrix cholodnii SP-6]